MTDFVHTLITDANVVVAAAIAFAAGIVSFASPCVVPLVPGYLSYITGLSGEELASGRVGARGRVLLGGALFVLGFAVPLTMIGVAVGTFFFLESNPVAQVVMGALVVVFGVLMATGRLTREVRLAGRAPGHGLLAAPVLGFVFGVGWTPCLGPALGAIMTLAAGGGTLRGGTLAFVYALGLGLPFIVFGLLFRRLSGGLAFLRRRARVLQAVGGGVLVTVGVAMITGLWRAFIVWLRPLVTGFEPPI
ncbi:MAG: cytochrome c biogenesis CcdA family protein [Actinomycetota bacterium]|nr:cytochrome c biogenesis CcdA family protein [Actinomycetota bacterium]